jgi:hypothetical protein
MISGFGAIRGMARLGIADIAPRSWQQPMTSQLAL